MISEIVSGKSQFLDQVSDVSSYEEADIIDWVTNSKKPPCQEECKKDSYHNKKVACKWEWFNSINLEFILESLRIQYCEAKDSNCLKLFKRLRHYALSADFPSCICPVTYRTTAGASSRDIGRIFGYTKSLHHEDHEMFASLQNFPKWVRSALASDFYWDIDLMNAHPSILLGLCWVKQVSYRKNLEVLVQDRDSVLNYIIDRFKLSERTAREQAKELLTVVFYGGSVYSWMKKNGVNDANSHCDFFDLETYAKEITEITRLMWEVDSFVDICPLIPSIKQQVCERFSDNPRKQRFSFLSLILQTEERIILGKLEVILHKHGRDMDTFIHDGGLVRKMIKKSSTEIMMNEIRTDEDDIWHSFDPLQFSIKTDLKKYEWEDQFPEKLLQTCSEELRAKRPRYKYLRLAIKPFDTTTWRANIICNLPRMQYLRKTFSEMEFFYESIMNLSFISSEKEYLFAGRFYSEEQLRQLAPEHYFVDIMRDEKYQVLLPQKQTDGEGQSHLEGNNPTEGNSDPLQLLLVDGRSKKGVKNKRNFWSRYCHERDKRTYDCIIFCEEELKCANMREPVKTNFTPLLIRPKYLILYSGIKSFSIMREQHTAEFLVSELELCHEQETDEESKNNAAAVEEIIPDKIIIDSQFIMIAAHEQERKVTVLREPIIPLRSLLSMRHNLSDDTMRKAACALNHFSLMLSNRVAEFLFVIKFIAKIIQHPTTLDEACGLIFYSKEEGVGKSFAAGMLVDLLAPFARETHDTKDVFGSFGNMQENCLLLHLEDADASEMKSFGSFFKNRLTARTITVERKHKDKVTRLNLCRFLITTNTLDIFPIGETDRRYTVLQCSTLLVNQKEYFRTLNTIWGLSSTKRAVMAVLNAIDLKEFSIEKEKPKTTPYKEMLSKSLSVIKRFMLGLSLWLWFHRYNDEHEISEEAMAFIAIYQADVNMMADHHHDHDNNVLWVRSQDLYDLFSKWIYQENLSVQKQAGKSYSHYNLSSFSKLVREMSPAFSKQQKDVNGRACLPVAVSNMIQEANKFGFNEVDDALPINRIILSLKTHICASSLDQNLPLSNSNRNRKQINPPSSVTKKIKKSLSVDDTKRTTISKSGEQFESAEELHRFLLPPQEVQSEGEVQEFE